MLEIAKNGLKWMTGSGDANDDANDNDNDEQSNGWPYDSFDCPLLLSYLVLTDICTAVFRDVVITNVSIHRQDHRNCSTVLYRKCLHPV